MGISEQGYSALVEQINHAALDPSGWSEVLHGLAAATDCIAGGLTIENPFDGTGDPITYFGFDCDHVAKTWHHYLPMNPLFAIGSRLQPGVIVANGMVCPVESFKKSEFYDGWARPQGICCPITLVLHRSGSAYIPLTLVRPDGRGDAEPEDFRFLARVAPLLERAFAVTLRLDRLNSRELALDEALSRLSVGLVLLEDNGRVAFANEIGEEMLLEADIIKTKGGVASLAAIPAMQTALAAARGPKGVMSEVVISREGQRPLLLTVTPVTRGDAFATHSSRITCAIIVGASDSSQRARSGGLPKAYGLTPKETRVLEAIMDGQDLRAAAETMGITRNTAQTHLRSIFAKTSLNRQGDLIRLAMGTSPPVRRSGS